MSEKITFKTVNIDTEKFLRVINPDQVYPSPGENILGFNTGSLYGSKNDNAFPDFLIDIYNNGSSTHQNLVNLKADLIKGNNLQAESDKRSPELEPFLRKRNKAGENLQDVYMRTAKDMALFDAAVIQLIYNRKGEIAEVYAVPTQNFRLGLPNKYGQIEWGYISQDWGQISNSAKQRSRKSVRIRMFSPSEWQKFPTQLMYIKNQSYDHYALPSYNAGIPWILIDRELSNFHLNNIRSNFFLSMMITQMKGGMSDDQIAENAEEIEKFYSGSKGRKVLLSYVDDMADAPKIDQISGTEQDKVFDVLEKQTFQNIVTAHRAMTVLAGYEGSTSDLNGDANKLSVSVKAFNELVCENMKDILLKGFNKIMEVNKLPGVICITEPLKLAQPLQDLNDLTLNERRRYLYGLPEIDESENNVGNPNLPTETQTPEE